MASEGQILASRRDGEKPIGPGTGEYAKQSQFERSFKFEV